MNSKNVQKMCKTVTTITRRTNFFPSSESSRQFNIQQKCLELSSKVIEKIENRIKPY